MAQPSQEFPPWLTQQITTLTNAAGEPTETQTSVVYLPLTYYGPSIPLGTEFTWGGLTPPASTSTTSALSTTSTTASVSSSTALTSSTAFPSSPSSIPSTSFTSTSPTTSVSTEPTSAAGGLPRSQLIGIIIGSILGFVFIFVFILVWYLCFNAKQKRRNREIEDDYDFVERSPRHSGEEADPFLQRSASGRDGQQPEMRELGVGAPAAGAAGVGTGNTGDNSLSSNASSSTGSGYGTVLDRPTISGNAAAIAAMGATSLAANSHKPILSREELRRLSEEEVTRSAADSGVSLRVVPSTANLNSEEMLPLMPPPRLHDSSAGQTRSPSRSSWISQGSAAEAKLMTARRVRAEDLEPRTPPTQVTDLPPTTSRNLGNEGTHTRRDSWKLPGWLGALPLIGAASSSSSSSRGHESERLMSSDELQPPLAIPRPGLFAGERPISSVSGKSAASGSTVYHDAHESPYSSSRGTTDIQPPKGVVARSSSAAEMGYRTGMRPSAPSSSSNLRQVHTSPPPAAYEDTTLSSTYSSIPDSQLQFPGPNVDVLDMPIPRTEPSFGSLKESSIGASSSDSQTQKKWPYPPGLELMKVGAWDDTEGRTPSLGSYGTRGVMDLDERPPSPGSSWRTLVRGPDEDHGRRATFGTAPMVHYSHGHESEAASMHTHMTPGSSGSGSHHHQYPTGSTGSSSSRRARSMLSGMSGTASFSSDSHGRNRFIRGPGTLSPVFGQPLSAARQEPYVSQPPVPPLPGVSKPGSPTLPQPAPAVTRTDRDVLELPWAAGLTENWSPT